MRQKSTLILISLNQGLEEKKKFSEKERLKENNVSPRESEKK